MRNFNKMIKKISLVKKAHKQLAEIMVLKQSVKLFRSLFALLVVLWIGASSPWLLLVIACPLVMLLHAAILVGWTRALTQSSSIS